MIYLVGLGVEKGDWSARAEAAIRGADIVLLRTELTRSAETVKEAGIPYESLDYLYEKSRNFDTLTDNIVKEVVRRSTGKNLCYCVDGGICEDRAALKLLGRKETTAIEGVSKGSYYASQAGVYGAITSVSAYEIEDKELTLPLVIYDIDSRERASEVKLILSDRFGDEAEAYLSNGSEGRKLPVYEMDRGEEYGAATAVVVYDCPLIEKKRFDFYDFIQIMKRLRAPDGCPWDKVQTHESIRINAIEEAYELVDAIDKKDVDGIQEEAGDVLMQAVFHTLIEEEKGTFNVADMVTAICEKLITRHTHVFGSDKAVGEGGALSVWEQNKMKEKHQTTASDAVNAIPQCFPALLRAQKLCKRMAKGGWDFSALDNIRRKLDEEYGELLEAYAAGDKEQISVELGDVLMCMAWLARAVGADAEQALLDSVKKVQKRFLTFEREVLADGKDPNALSDEEWKTYYQRAKHEADEA